MSLDQVLPEGEVSLFPERKLIIRYKNRKLYDKETSSYITLKKIFDYYLEGFDVHVVKKDTQEDISVETMLAALVEACKGLTKKQASEEMRKLAQHLSICYSDR